MSGELEADGADPPGWPSSSISEQELRNAFDFFDMDGSGGISVRDLDEALQHLRLELRLVWQKKIDMVEPASFVAVYQKSSWFMQVNLADI